MRLYLPLLLLPVLMIGAGCKKKTTAKPQRPAVIAERLNQNQLRGVPSAVLTSYADSPVHWQVWEPSIVEDATKARRLIFAVAITSRTPGSDDFLKTIEADRRMVQQINSEFIPVLIDVDICREISLIAANLSVEQKDTIAFPFLLILSPAGAPISWKSFPVTDPETLHGQLERILEVLVRMWHDSPDYVSKDSMEKLIRRSENLRPLEESVTDPEARRDVLVAATRNMLSRYDKYSRSMDGIGGLFPAPFMSFLSDVIASGLLPAEQVEIGRDALDGLFEEVFTSAMVDPLDGGLYSIRIRKSWNHPAMIRDLHNQSTSVQMLCKLVSQNGMHKALEPALRAASFIETEFGLPDGLFSSSYLPGPTDERPILWTTQELESVLSPEEYQVWKRRSNIDTLGNVPPESDPQRSLFRLNVLNAARTVEDIASELSVAPEQVREWIDSGARKLLKIRQGRPGQPQKSHVPSALASFQMIRTYAALHTGTGDPQWREKAVKLGERCLEMFGQAKFFNERPGENPSPMTDSRAYAYALAAAAYLDLGGVTLDPVWNQRAVDVMTLLGENFVSEDYRLFEARKVSGVINIDYEDRAMIFTDSTYGLLRWNLQVLSKLGLAVPPQLQPWLTSLPGMQGSELIHTDTLEALVTEFGGSTITVGSGAPEEVVEAVSRLPLTLFLRKKSESLSTNIEILGFDGERGRLESTNDVKALLPR